MGFFNRSTNKNKKTAEVNNEKNTKHNVYNDVNDAIYDINNLSADITPPTYSKSSTYPTPPTTSTFPHFSESSAERDINYLNERLNNYPQSAIQNDVVRREAESVIREMTERAFKRKYEELEKLERSVSFYNNFGIMTNDLRDKYSNYFKIPKEEREILFLPYYKEKELLNILSSTDKKEYASILSKVNNITSGSPTMPKDFKGFCIALCNLQALGVIDVADENIFTNAFNYFGNANSLKEMVKEIAPGMRKMYGFSEKDNAFSFDSSKRPTSSVTYEEVSHKKTR